MMKFDTRSEFRRLILLGACIVVAQGDAVAQEPSFDQSAEAARQERLTERFEREARVLTVFDREGNEVMNVGDRALFGIANLSPDGKRVAAPISDIFAETFDIWIYDVDSSQRHKLIDNAKVNEEWTAQPVWSPDGSEVAYVALRDGYEGIYRIRADGESPEELLYRDDRANLILGDWSLDGRYISFSISDGYFEGSLYVLPTDGNGERPPVEVLHSTSQLQAGSFSPDSRLLSFVSDETGRNEFYILQLDMTPLYGSDLSDPVIHRISERGSGVALRSGWNADGSETYFIAADRGFMATTLDSSGETMIDATSLLFRPSLAIGPGELRASVSRDGQRVLISAPDRQMLNRIAVFSRSGEITHELGEPGIYRNPSFSPDGETIAVRRLDPDTNLNDIWTFDVASGVATAITRDDWEDNWPIWSPDGTQIAYGTIRGIYSEIYIEPAAGTDEPQLAYRYSPGAFLQVTDWSADGEFLTFHDGCWGILYAVPLQSFSPEAPDVIELLRDEFQVTQARISPDGHFFAYLTDELEPDVFQLHIAPFNPNQQPTADADSRIARLSGFDVAGMVTWRQDGREIYFMTDDWEVMAVAVQTTPELELGEPELLFRLPEPPPGNPKQWKSVSADGERFVFVVQVPVTD